MGAGRPTMQAKQVLFVLLSGPWASIRILGVSWRIRMVPGRNLRLTEGWSVAPDVLPHFERAEYYRDGP